MIALPVRWRCLGVLGWLGACLVLSACTKKAEPAVPRPAQEVLAADDRASARAFIDVSEIATDGEVLLTWVMEVDAGLAPMTPEVGEKIGDFTVIGREAPRDELTPRGRTRVERRWVLEPFLPGEYEVPGLDFGYAPIEGGEGRRLRTGPMRVVVTSVLTDEDDDIAEARGVLEALPPEPFKWRLVWAAAGGAALCGVLVWVIVWTHRRMKRRDVVFPAALARVQALRGQLPELAGARREVWSEAGVLIASCAAGKLEPNARHMSTQEIIASSLGWYGMMDQDREALSRLLRDMDDVRYAGEEPGEDQTRDMLTRTERVIESMRGASDLVVDFDRAGGRGPERMQA